MTAPQIVSSLILCFTSSLSLWSIIAKKKGGCLHKRLGFLECTGQSNFGKLASRPRRESPIYTASMIPRLIVAIAALWSVCTAHNIQLKAHSRECFHESLHTDDKMTVTFQVGDREFGGSGNLEIDFWVRSYLCVWANQMANSYHRFRIR